MVSDDVGVERGCGQCPGTGFQKIGAYADRVLNLLSKKKARGRTEAKWLIQLFIMTMKTTPIMTSTDTR